MKKIFKKSIIVCFIACLFSLSVKAQTWNIPSTTGGGTSTAFIGTTSNNDMSFKTNNTETMKLTTSGNLNILASNPAININSTLDNFHSTWLNFQHLGSTLFQIGRASFPGSGSGTFQMIPSGSGTKGINFKSDGTKISFGSSLYAFASGTFINATYLFDDLVGTPSLLISDNSSPLSVPSGYTLAVKSNSYFGGNVGIGISTFPSTAPTGGYKLALSGNANLNGTVVIGDPSTITATTPFPTGYKLYVTDGILTEKVKVAVKSTTDWSDFVFADNYQLKPLEAVGAYIKEHRHLPDVPSAEEVASEGIDVAKMDAVLLQKIEELTLYMLQMKEENEALKKEMQKLKEEITVQK